MRKQLKGVTLKRQKNWIDKHEESLLVGNSYIPFWTVLMSGPAELNAKLSTFAKIVLFIC